MFFKVRLVYDLTLPPSLMGGMVEKLVHEKLKESVEGQPLGETGYVVCVLRIFEDWKGTGVVDDMTASASYKINYEALVFRPFRNQTLDAVVQSVSQWGFFCMAGPVRLFVSKQVLPEGFKNGFNPNTSAFENKEANAEIKSGSPVRLKVLNTTVHVTSFDASGSMPKYFYGLIP